MAWTAPITWVGGQVPTAALLNAQLRDNLLETMPAKATTEGQIFVGNGPNSITTRIPAAAQVSALETRSSTTYGNLATVGPSVTVTHGTYAIIFWSARFFNSLTDADTHMSWEMSGSNVRAADDFFNIRQDGVNANSPWRVGGVDVHQALTPGTTTFTAKYRVDSGTGSWQDRFIGVIPL
jgi:hypothetical protein